MPHKRKLGIESEENHYERKAKRRILHAWPYSRPIRVPDAEGESGIYPVFSLPKGKVLAYYSASESSADTNWESRSDPDESEADTPGDMNNLEETRWLVNPNSVKKIPRDSTPSYSIGGRLDDPSQKTAKGFLIHFPI